MVLATGIGDAGTLIAGLKSLAAESSAPWSNRIHQLRVLLEQGQSLSEALTTTSGLLPDQSLIAIRIGEETGTLKQVLAEEAHRLMKQSDNASPIQASLPATLGWFFSVGNVALSVVGFIMIFIIPKFKKIFEDFNTDLPIITKQLILMSDWLLNFWYLIILPMFTVVCFGAFYLLHWRIQSLSKGRTAFAEYFPRYWSPLILRLLSITVAAGRSLGDSLHSILRELQPGAAATKLSAVRMRMSAGDNCWDSLNKEGFLKKREVAFLDAANRTNHLDWGLLHLARTIERSRRKWGQIATNLLQPVIVLSAGFAVAFICIALFLPLVKLLNDLS
jgi:type II secretory pathway component PulF